MVNFIICEDNKELNKQYQNIIDKLCISLKISYQTHVFFDYDEDFFKIMKQDLPFKIYILDIEADSCKGTEVASKIRRKDLKSFIIFITSHYLKYSKKLLESKYMFLKYINKDDDYKKILEEAIYSVICDLDKNHIISIKKKDITYKFEDTDIIYLYYENRKTHIVTSQYEIDTSQSLKYFFNILPKHFFYSHKACIVNINKICRVDKTNKKIIFKNGLETNLLSKNYSPDILDKVSS